MLARVVESAVIGKDRSDQGRADARLRAGTAAPVRRAAVSCVCARRLCSAAQRRTRL